MPDGVPSSQPAVFRAVLHPHRSLGPRGFRILMGAMVAVSVAIGGLFLANGAWPVVGFFGLDVLLVWLAFQASYRSGRLYETVELTPERLTVQRVEPARPVRTWTFQPYWLRVAMDDPPQHHSHVTLSSRGTTVIVGSFLSPPERLDFANALRRALDRVRRPPGAG